MGPSLTIRCVIRSLEHFCLLVSYHHQDRFLEVKVPGYRLDKFMVKNKGNVRRHRGDWETKEGGYREDLSWGWKWDIMRGYRKDWYWIVWSSTSRDTRRTLAGESGWSSISTGSKSRSELEY